MIHQPPRFAALALTLGLLAGCATEPSAPALSGRFGGPMLLVVASDTAAYFHFVCQVARTGPLRPNAFGVAEERGWAAGTWAGNRPEDFRVVVRQRADTLTVFSTFIADAYVRTDSHTVRRDAPADYGYWACLDAT